MCCPHLPDPETRIFCFCRVTVTLSRDSGQSQYGTSQVVSADSGQVVTIIITANDTDVSILCIVRDTGLVTVYDTDLSTLCVVRDTGLVTVYDTDVSTLCVV